MAYDIFISYRRSNEQLRTNGTEIARSIKQQLELCGYRGRIFFDYSVEEMDDYFETVILSSLEKCKLLILVLSRDSMGRVVNDGDWVRREVLRAKQCGLKIIPVDPDKQFDGFPAGLPEELSFLPNIHRTVIHMDESFENDIDRLIKHRIEAIVPPLKPSFWNRYGTAIISAIVVVGVFIGFALFRPTPDPDPTPVPTPPDSVALADVGVTPISSFQEKPEKEVKADSKEEATDVQQTKEEEIKYQQPEEQQTKEEEIKYQQQPEEQQTKEEEIKCQQQLEEQQTKEEEIKYQQQPEEQQTKEEEIKYQQQPEEQQTKEEEETKRRSALNIEMVYVAGGAFMMGASSSDSEAFSDEKPAHSVTLSGYYIGKYEVTQKQWVEIMGSNLSEFKGDNLPVENVSWNNIQEFLRKLNVKTGKNYRLPTEAEWEFAARGGNSSRGYKYSGSDNIGAVAWYGDNSGQKTHPVGTKSPNELGIYDMTGNVWEWCQDWYDYDYDSSSPSSNPKGPSSGAFRVLRGGGWSHGARNCRVSNRSHSTPSRGYSSRGFRLAASL